MSAPAQYLISAIIRTGDLQTALDKGVTVDAVNGFGPEWDRIISSYRDYGRTPDKAWMKAQFPDFTIKVVDNVAHYADEVMAEHRIKSAVTFANKIIDERLRQGDGDGDVVATAKAIDAIIDKYASNSTALKPRQQQQVWSASDLIGGTFSELRWAVPGLIPDGVTVIASTPKIGKSALVRNILTAITDGQRALGSIEVEHGPALYIALEDTPRRLQHRFTQLGLSKKARLDVMPRIPLFKDGGAQVIEQWLREHPDARMVVIDTLQKIRGVESGSGNAYGADYHIMGKIKDLADDYGVPFLVVHHTRKAGAEDFVESLNATNGMAGAVDTVMVMQRTRGQADAVLRAVGRDVDEIEQALQGDPATLEWTLMEGPVLENIVSDTRAEVLRHLRKHPGSTPKKIADATGLDHEVIKKTCKRMEREGFLTATIAGAYTLRDKTGASKHVPGVPRVPEDAVTREKSRTRVRRRVPRRVPDVPDDDAAASLSAVIHMERLQAEG